MRTLAFVFIILSFLASSVSAALYYWIDEKGVIHITDVREKIPPGYRDKAKVMESGEEKPGEPGVEPPVTQPKEKEEVYGDHPLSWWLSNLRRKEKEIENGDKELEEKSRYIEVFEKGRRIGQIYTDEEAAAYIKYKADIPDIGKRIKNLKEELADLRRKATYYGVPKEIRGE
ncbi:MAG: DUF4124 domain-containing protein [Deltaproteobacteria bacterium]|nr:DUF4124 domain-containing protein [Deltaproteobacteria bacterium]